LNQDLDNIEDIKQLADKIIHENLFTIELNKIVKSFEDKIELI